MGLTIKINKTESGAVKNATLTIPLEILEEIGIDQKDSKFVAELQDNELIIKNTNNNKKDLVKKEWIIVTQEEKEYLLRKTIKKNNK